MQFHDYTKYLDMGCRLALLPLFQWNGRPADRFPYAQAARIIFILNTCSVIYHSFGILVNFNQVIRMANNTKAFVAEISEATGTLMLISLTICNLIALTTFRPEFEKVFTELQELYPGPIETHYRREHYFEKAIRLMKFEFIFFILFFVYYNGVPFVGLIWEYMTIKKVQSYSLQLNTWFPWKVQGSPLGFGAAYLNIFLTSFVGVGLSIITQDIICIFTYQLKLHFDALSSQLCALDSSQPGAHAKLRELIAYHSRILQIGEQVNCILNFSFLASLICATIAICMTSVAILLLDLVSAIRHLNGLVGFVVYHFAICYLGTEVTLAVSLNCLLKGEQRKDLKNSITCR